MPPFAYLISGTVVGLLTLRKGLVFGLQTMSASLLILLLASLLAGLPYQLCIGYALGIWLPVSLTAMVLRWTESQGLALLASGLIATLVIVAMYVLVDDVAGWWRSWIEVMLEKNVSAQELVQYQQALQPASVLFNAIVSVGVMLNIFTSLLLARWWQSNLFNKGAFRKEFYALRLPPLVLAVSGLLVILTLFSTESLQGMCRDILFVMIFMYLVQGVSAVHRVVEKYGLSGAWLIAMYCMLLLVPQIGVLIACLGMTDVYINWRRKNEISGPDS